MPSPTTAPGIVDGRYSTSSWVSSMNASSSDAVIGVSSWTRRPWRAARSPICGAVSPSTVNDPPPSSLPTVAPAPPSAVVNAATSGVTSLTAPPPLRATKSATLVSAISRPRPITTSRSAVSDISLIRWLDTNTVRPCAARSRRKWRTQRMPSGSSPLTGSSKSSTPGSPSRAAAMPSRWPMPSENFPARRSATEVSPTWSSTSSTRRSGMSFESASQRRWPRAVRPGWNALASSSAPTWRSGHARSAYGWPPISADPESGTSRPMIMRIVVDLPEPFGPRNPVTTPGGTSNVRWSTAVAAP